VRVPHSFGRTAAPPHREATRLAFAASLLFLGWCEYRHQGRRIWVPLDQDLARTINVHSDFRISITYPGGHRFRTYEHWWAYRCQYAFLDIWPLSDGKTSLISTYRIVTPRIYLPSPVPDNPKQAKRMLEVCSAQALRLSGCTDYPLVQLHRYQLLPAWSRVTA
jgi:hypothetical protein